MKERPIIFSGEMIRAIPEGRKTQTRRVVKFHKPFERHDSWPYCGKLPDNTWMWADAPIESFPEWCRQGNGVKCPYGQVGDRLWVREGFWLHKSLLLIQAGAMFWKGTNPAMYYDADLTEHERRKGGWLNNWYRRIPSIFMPRWASRITLEITDLKVEKQLDITLEDAIKEGFGSVYEFNEYFLELNPHLKEVNPWVWVIKFKELSRRQEVPKYL